MTKQYFLKINKIFGEYLWKLKNIIFCVFAFHASKQHGILNVRMLQGLGLMENYVFCVPNIFTDVLFGRLRAKRDPKNKLHYYLYGFQFNNFFKFISQILLSVMYIIGSWGHEKCPCSMSLLIDVFMFYVIIDSRSMTEIFNHFEGLEMR